MAESGKPVNLTNSQVERRLALTAVLLILTIGLGLGFGLPAKEAHPGPYTYVSSVLGWTYFAAWSLSFYPQVYDNWRRKSCEGLSFDFELFNLLGFTCYAVFNSAFFWSSKIQQAYQDLHGRPNIVQPNDVVFALHACALTLVAIGQCLYYTTPNQPRLGRFCKVFCTSVIIVTGLYFAATALGRQDLCTCFTYLQFLFLLSYIKLAVSFFKYMPQVILNHQRQSTAGWNIGNVLLDLTGGLLSLLQVSLDASILGDWSSITGTPVKFGLSIISLTFCFIFMTQHYVLYNPARKAAAGDSSLLDSSADGWAQSVSAKGAVWVSGSTADEVRQPLLADGEGRDEEEGAGAQLASSAAVEGKGKL